MSLLRVLHAARVLRAFFALVPLAFVAACSGGGGGGGGGGGAVATAPVITTAPASKDAIEGDTVTFTVTAAGSGPLAYQWERDGVALPNAVAATLDVPAVTRADDGASFTVQVSNAAGRVSSAPALLHVRERPLAPTIVTSPLAAAATVGQAVHFTVVASGSAPLRYQWQRGGTDIGGATAADLALTASADLDGTTYSVTVTNDVGTVTSAAATLTVLPVPVAPRFVEQPADTSVLEGERVVLRAAVTGTPPFAWQWLRDDSAIGGAINATLDLGAAALAQGGARYSVRVTNAAGVVQSADARLEVRAAPFLELLAGNTGGRGNLDGTGAAATLGEGGGIAYDAAGNLWLADTQSHVIRKVTPAGVVTTVAGGKDVSGSDDGPAAAARFYGPYSLAVAPDGDIVIADTFNGTVRRLSAAGQVTTIAGQPMQYAHRDGAARDARFNSPTGVVVDRSGSIFVVDTGSRAVREIAPDGQVSTLAGNGTSAAVDGVGAAASFRYPIWATCATPAVVCEGALLVIDAAARTVRRVRIAPGPAGEPKGEVTTVAGGGSLFDDNVAPLLAQFRSPAGVAALSPTRFLVADGADRTLREVDLTVAPGTVRVVSGTRLQDGWGDGRGTDVRWSSPADLAVRPSTGEVAVFDAGNTTLRRLAQNGAVLTLAGRSPMRGFIEGAGSAAHFSRPGAVAVDAAGALVVAEPCTLRRIEAGVVSKFAGGVCGALDGPAQTARFGSALALAIDAAGVVWVADAGSSTVRRVARDGTVTTVAGAAGVRGDVQGPASVARFGIPSDIAVEATGDLVVVDSFTCRVLRVASASGAVTSLAGDGTCGVQRDGPAATALFERPARVAVTTLGEIWVADGARIRRIARDGTVSTVAGSFVPGDADGLGAAAHFNALAMSLAPSPNGGVLVADRARGLVREVLPTGLVRTVIGVRRERGAVLGAQPRLSGPAGIAYEPASRRLSVVDQGGVFSAVLP